MYAIHKFKNTPHNYLLATRHNIPVKADRRQAASAYLRRYAA
jgi:hypothetical protein